MANSDYLGNVRGPIGPIGPQGLPGVNAVDNDTAVAGYVSTAGTSATQTALDVRYTPWSGVKDSDGTSYKVTDALWGAGDNWWNINIDSTKIGYGFHLTSGGPNVRVMGIGVDTEGSTGLLVSHKDGATAGGIPSKGIYLDHQIAINAVGDETSYGFHGRQASNKAPLMFLESYFGGSAPVLRLKGTTWGAGQVLFDQILSGGATAWQFFADTGNGDFFTPMRFGASTGNAGGVVLRSATGQAVLFYGYTGSASDFYRFAIRRGNTNPTELAISGAGVGSTVDGTETYQPFVRMDIAGVDRRIGFLGAAPRVQAEFYAATGTKTRTTFNTATVTTAQLAERVASLIDILGNSSGYGLLSN